MAAKKCSDINYYEVLGIDIDAQESDIRKAYRKKALECHPDKNPDNPKAAELFHALSNALAILTDPTAKAAFDKVLKAKKAAELRNKQLDSKRQKLKADLEQREQDYFNDLRKHVETFAEQFERISRENSKLLQEEQRLIKEQLQRTLQAQQSQQQQASFDSSQHRIKIKWQAEKTDSQNGGYSEEKLRQFLKKYGEIVALVMSKKRGSALVEFSTLDAAEMAIAYEKGILENPLKLDWLTPPLAKKPIPNSTVTVSDYEDLVMRKMRQAEERKRLIEQMQKEEEAEEGN